MISCTEFIPCYNALFKYIEKKHGKNAVRELWDYLFEPDGEGIPLINYVEREGLRGMYSYHADTLNEEATDFTMYIDEKAGWTLCDIHWCPSKGRLIKYHDEIGIEMYEDYCLHCDCYRSALEKGGLEYIFNFRDTDKAACSFLTYDPKVFDGRIIINKDTEMMDRRASDNEYYHKDFHSSMNMGVEFLGKTYGTEEVKDFLKFFTEDVYRNVIADARTNGLSVIEQKIKKTYHLEHSDDRLEISNDGKKLEVKVSSCPAIEHLKATGRRVSEWFRYTTETVMKTLADESDLGFRMVQYNADSGAAQYEFCKEA